MLSKKQKTKMLLSGIAAVIVGLFIAIPFRSFPGLSSIDGILTIDLIAKIALAVIAVLLALYPLVKKYRLLGQQREYSKTILVMTYFPILVFVAASVLNIIYTLSFDYTAAGLDTVLSSKVLGINIVLLVVFLTFAIYCVVRIFAVAAKLDKKEHIILDTCLGVVFICFAFKLIYINNAYNDAYSVQAADLYFKGNPLLLVIFVLLIILTVLSIKFVVEVVKKDEVIFHYTDGEAFEQELMRSELIKAYNETLDDFEDFFDENLEEYKKLEIKDIEETDEEELVKPVVNQEVKVEVKKIVIDETNETFDETPEKIETVESDELKELISQKEAISKAIEEKNAALLEVRSKKTKLEEDEAELRKAKEQYEAELAKFAEFKLSHPVNDAPVEEPKKKVKKFTPTFEKVVEYAESFKETEGFRAAPNAKGTLIKYYLGKKLFLVLQATASDYRISFITTQEKFLNLVTSRPGQLIVPKNLKDNNWLRFTNKGKEEFKDIKSFIKGAVETAKKQLEDEALEKAAARKAKAKERAAARAAEKAAAKENA